MATKPPRSIRSQQKDFIQSTVEPGAMEHSDETSALAKLERLLLGAAAAIDADEAVIPLTLEFWSVCGVEQTRERFGRQYEALFSAYRGLLVGLLEEAKTQGEIDANVPSMALASCLIAMIDGLLIQQWTAEEIKASVVLHEALPVLLGSLRRKP